MKAETTRQLTVASAYYSFLSHLYTGMLSVGVDPLKATGYTTLATIPVIPAFGSALNQDNVLHWNPRMLAVVTTLICVMISAGILL